MSTKQATLERPDSGCNDAPAVVLTPRADGWETSDAYFLSVEMPGVDDAHVDVTLEKNVLTIAGRVELAARDGFEPVMGMTRGRNYERSFRLPEGIDRGAFDASVQNGLLTIRMPKAPSAQRQQIAIRKA